MKKRLENSNTVVPLWILGFRKALQCIQAALKSPQHHVVFSFQNLLAVMLNVTFNKSWKMTCSSFFTRNDYQNRGVIRGQKDICSSPSLKILKFVIQQLGLYIRRPTHGQRYPFIKSAAHMLPLSNLPTFVASVKGRHSRSSPTSHPIPSFLFCHQVKLAELKKKKIHKQMPGDMLLNISNSFIRLVKYKKYQLTAKGCKLKE